MRLHETMMSMCLAAAFLLTGCGKGDGGDASSDPDITGTWSFANFDGEQESMTLVQSGNDVAGTTSQGGRVWGSYYSEDLPGITRGRPVSIDAAHAASSGHYEMTVEQVYYNYNLTLMYLRVAISQGREGEFLEGTLTDSSGNTKPLTATKVDTTNDNAPADAAHDARLVGTWESTWAGEEELHLCTLTFSSNGDFISENGDTREDRGTWETAGNRLTITLDTAQVGEDETVIHTYEISGDTLTLTGSDGSGSSWTRQH